MKLPALLGKYDRPTDGQTGSLGSFTYPIICFYTKNTPFGHCDLNHSIFVSFVIVFILDWTPCHPSPSPPLPSSLFQLDPRPAAAASCDPCLATNPTTNPSSPPPFPPDRQAASPPLPLLPQPAGSFPTLAPRPRCTRPAAPTGAQLFFFPAA